MKEKIKAFFTSEKLRGAFKKVFRKKVIIIAVSALVLILALRIAFSLMFEVKGVVKKVDGKSIVVVNFLTTKTVNTGDYPIDGSKIQVGERVKILKNLSGDIVSIRTDDKRTGFRSGQPGNGRGQGKQGRIGNEGIQNKGNTQTNGTAGQQPYKGAGARR